MGAEDMLGGYDDGDGSTGCLGLSIVAVGVLTFWTLVALGVRALLG